MGQNSAWLLTLANPLTLDRSSKLHHLGYLISETLRSRRIITGEMVSITNSMDMNLGKLWEMVKHREAWHATVQGVTESWTQLRD